MTKRAYRMGRSYNLMISAANRPSTVTLRAVNGGAARSWFPNRLPPRLLLPLVTIDQAWSETEKTPRGGNRGIEERDKRRAKKSNSRQCRGGAKSEERRSEDSSRQQAESGVYCQCPLPGGARP